MKSSQNIRDYLFKENAKIDNKRGVKCTRFKNINKAKNASCTDISSPLNKRKLFY